MKVSILMLVYNHEKFIAQAIESALMQDVNFDYEVVIGEDCSTDNTRNIVIEYQRRYPDKIRLLLPETNLGMHKNFSQTLHTCNGEYIAILEGDDYWISPHKLQKQVDFLDNHPECTICFHDAVAHWEDNSNAPVRFGSSQKEILSIEDLLLGNFIVTPSLMYRGGLVVDLPNWLYELNMVDWPFAILNAQHGYIGYINEAMTLYRIHSSGVWSSRSQEWQIQETIKALKTFMIYLDDKYKLVINTALSYNYDRLARWHKFEAEKIQNSLIENLSKNLRLNDINIIIFPNWCKSKELLYEDLSNVIRSIVNHQCSNKITLLIDNSTVFIDEAEFILFDIIMSLLREDIELTEEPGISLIGELNNLEWKLLLDIVTARIVLNNEDQQVMLKVGAKNILTISLEEFESNKDLSVVA